MKRAAFLLPLAVLLFACAPPQEDPASVRRVIEEMTKLSQTEMLSGVFDTTLARYTDDAVTMPNNEPMVKGKAAIREHMKQMLGMGLKFTEVAFVTLDVQVSGSMAYEIGTYSMTMEIPGMGKIPDAGKYLTVYERGADGKWRIKVETWNTNTMPAMPPAGS